MCERVPKNGLVDSDNEVRHTPATSYNRNRRWAYTYKWTTLNSPRDVEIVVSTLAATYLTSAICVQIGQG